MTWLVVILGQVSGQRTACWLVSRGNGADGELNLCATARCEAQQNNGAMAQGLRLDYTKMSCTNRNMGSEGLVGRLRWT